MTFKIKSVEMENGKQMCLIACRDLHFQKRNEVRFVLIQIMLKLIK